MIFLTTTAIRHRRRLMNRCIVLTVDENREQTARSMTTTRERHSTIITRQSVGCERPQLPVQKTPQRLLRSLAGRQSVRKRTSLSSHDSPPPSHPYENYLSLFAPSRFCHQHHGSQIRSNRTTANPRLHRKPRGDIALARVALSDQVLGKSIDERTAQSRRPTDGTPRTWSNECDART